MVYELMCVIDALSFALQSFQLVLSGVAVLLQFIAVLQR